MRTTALGVIMFVLPALGVSAAEPDSEFRAEDYNRRAPLSSNSDQAIKSKSTDLDMVLTKTAAAPLEATGNASVRAGTLSVNLRGLSAGRYDLIAVRKSDGLPVLLGTMAINDPTTTPDRDANESKQQANWSGQSSILAVQTTVSLPPDLQAAQIAQLKISSGGNDLLLGNPSP